MNKKNLWISLGVIAILIPVIVVLCLYTFVWRDKEVDIVPETVLNGGTIEPADQTAVGVDVETDGTTVSDALYEFKSQYGYSLQYNNKYPTDLSGSQYDFYISNVDDNVRVAITPMPKAEEFVNIQTKEEWDAAMVADMGECVAFKRTKINGMDVLVSNYNFSDRNGENTTDVLMAMFIGEEYIYLYFYTAAMDADETEKQQIGAILYTIQQ